MDVYALAIVDRATADGYGGAVSYTDGLGNACAVEHAYSHHYVDAITFAIVYEYADGCADRYAYAESDGHAPCHGHGTGSDGDGASGRTAPAVRARRGLGGRRHPRRPRPAGLPG